VRGADGRAKKFLTFGKQSYAVPVKVSSLYTFVEDAFSLLRFEESSPNAAPDPRDA
jgi:hypothetical protein